MGCLFTGFSILWKKEELWSWAVTWKILYLNMFMSLSAVFLCNTVNYENMQDSLLFSKLIFTYTFYYCSFRFCLSILSLIRSIIYMFYSSGSRFFILAILIFLACFPSTFWKSFGNFYHWFNLLQYLFCPLTLLQIFI